MADKERIVDYQIQIMGTDSSKPVDVVTDEDTENALKVKGNVVISGSSGSQQVLSKANRFETNKILSTGTWDIILNLTVPSGYNWYLKGMIIGTGKTAEWRLKIGGTVKVQGHIDADDSVSIPLYGYEIIESEVILLELNCGAANQTLEGNITIYEEPTS